MNIKRAKEEIKNSIEAYLVKDEQGNYVIPSIRQRPILLMGPPGIGKTQIMEQISRECQIGLVAYTITHHTRQSAVGLPFIKERTYGGRKFSVTEYTMSEIIASVYEKMESTGLLEGILFIDEINCVSETLAPAMLQFLQGKTFGNQKLPEGWIIVAAGNPPEYNKSVREFDLVTLDRLKRIWVEEDFEVWKEYAYRESIHSAVISYLDAKREHFYRIETTVDGKAFATARGWEDLSQLIYVYETLKKTVDREVVYQYIQHPVIARDFANYLELYYKYREDYRINEILSGNVAPVIYEKLKFAPFDEKLSVIGALLASLGGRMKRSYEEDQYVTLLFEQLKAFKAALEGAAESLMAEAAGQHPAAILEEQLAAAREAAEWKKQAGQQRRQEEKWSFRMLETMERMVKALKTENFTDSGQAFDLVRNWFAAESEHRQTVIDETSQTLDYGFTFMEEAFGDSQEMVVFITELNASFYSIWFIKENGCDRYYRYNKGLLFDERQQEILAKIEELEP